MIEKSDMVLEFVNSMDKSQGIQLRFVIRRQLMGEILTTFLPSTLLMIIVYATAHFKPKYFEAALNLNLGVMFVMTTLFVSVMERLPRTSYLRMVDIWLIYGQVMPFVEVILLTFMTMKREELEDEKQKRKTGINLINNRKKDMHTDKPTKRIKEAPYNLKSLKVSSLEILFIKVSEETTKVNGEDENDCNKKSTKTTTDHLYSKETAVKAAKLAGK